MAEAPDFRGGYYGEQVVPSGGGYDPFAPQNYTGPSAPDFRGGYYGEQTVSTGGGYDPNSTSRDLGKQIQSLKPDGTPSIESGVIPSILRGKASVTTGELPTSPYGTTDSATIIPSILQSSGKTSVDNKFKNVIANPLEKFSSYSVLWTMASLSAEQFNNPSTYRGNPSAIENVVFSSAGRYDEKRVTTYFGTPEYFVNNFSMRAVIASTKKTGNSNAIKIEFDIYEPYSMGLFLQSLQRAAGKSQHPDYLTAPFVLIMDIVGYDELGKSYKAVKSKYFVVKLISVKFQVNESGSIYKVEALPFNHQGFSDEINTAFNDLKLKGGSKGTVEEILTEGNTSLVGVLNNIEKELVNDKKIKIPDEYQIQFPNSSSEFISTSLPPGFNTATIDPTSSQTQTVGTNSIPVSTQFTSNPIGKSSLGFDASSGGNVPFMDHRNVLSSEGYVLQNLMLVDPKNRTFQFSQGQALTEIITRVIINSDYAVNAIKSENLTAEGFVKWFRIDVQIEFLKFDDLIGDYARRYTYRVVPYLIHHTVFTNVNSPPVGYDVIKEKVCKKYEYIYTGQNVDILKFDIDINNLFYVGVNSSSEKRSNNVSNQDQKGSQEADINKSTTGTGTTPAAILANTGRKRALRDPESITRATTGSGDSKTAVEIAESFHKAFIEGSSADLIKVNLEILGDPYWMVDSGLANYFAPPAGNDQQTMDGTMNYEAGDVFIYLSFKTPTDVDEVARKYKFSSVGRDSEFSGIYRVVMCDSTFTDGYFKQKLECLRMPGQANDYLEGTTPLPEVRGVKTDTMATEVKEPVKTGTTIGKMCE